MVQRYMTFASSIANLHKNIQKLERKEMERFGLKGPHGQCLLAVAAHPEGVTAARLCQLCDKNKAAISRSLAELEKMGLVDCSGGYRARLILTEEGNRIAREVSVTVKNAMEKASLGLEPQQRKALYEMLSQIAGNLEIVCEKGVPTE